MRVVIVANGHVDLQAASRILQPDDLLIAADGGLRHFRQLGWIPSILIGDLDSLTETEVSVLQPDGVQVIRHPADKDYTDLELALRYAQSLGANEIIILGALGDRWDHTLANLLLPASEYLKETQIRLLDGPQEIIFLRGRPAGASLEIHGEPGDTVSLIPLFGDARGVSTHGLQYPLHGEMLAFGATRGVSNVMIGNQAGIQLQEGMLMCIIIHSSESPEEV